MISIPAPVQLAKQKELNMFGKPVENAHVITIADALKTNMSLKFVGFRECRNVTDAGALAIAKSLVFNGTVKMLNFESTGVGDKGVVALAEALPNSAVTRLELGYLRITDASALALATAIKLSTTLTTVTLDHCKGITEEGGRALAQALEKNVLVTQLGLKGTSVGKPVRAAVEALLTPAGLVKRQCGTADSIISQIDSAPAPIPSSSLVRGFKSVRREKSIKGDVLTGAGGSAGFGSSGGSTGSGSGSARVAMIKRNGAPASSSAALSTPRKERAERDPCPRADGKESGGLSSSGHKGGAKETIISSPLVAAEAKEARKNLQLLKGRMDRRAKRASFGHGDGDKEKENAGAKDSDTGIVSPETIS